MSSLLEKVKKYVGTESEPIVYVIDTGAIKFFAESIMDPDPLYWDEGYAKTTKHGGIVAPPSFYGGVTCLRNVRGGDARTVASIGVPMPPEWVGLNAGEDFEQAVDVGVGAEAGDTLTSQEKLVDAYEKQGLSGHLIFVIREKTFTNQHGQVVLVRRGTSVYRQSVPEEERHQ